MRRFSQNYSVDFGIEVENYLMTVFAGLDDVPFIAQKFSPTNSSRGTPPRSYYICGHKKRSSKQISILLPDKICAETDATVWDGHIQVRFTVTDGNETGVDEVAMKLAPVLFHHHLQAVDTLVTQHSNNSGESQNRFVAQLDAARAKTSIKKPLLKLPGDNIWAQDFLEPGYSSMPGPNGKPISIRVIVRSAQSTRNAGRQVFTRLRGKGIGGYQPTGKGAYGFREINSGGNIETIPPYGRARHAK